MHNWWIAALEHFGLVTREEAEHISNNIKLGIHRENYAEAFRELEAILADAKVKTEPLVSRLESRIRLLEDAAVTEVKKTVASKSKA